MFKFVEKLVNGDDGSKGQYPNHAKHKTAFLTAVLLEVCSHRLRRSVRFPFRLFGEWMRHVQSDDVFLDIILHPVNGG